MKVFMNIPTYGSEFCTRLVNPATANVFAKKRFEMSAPAEYLDVGHNLFAQCQSAEEVGTKRFESQRTEPSSVGNSK